MASRREADRIAAAIVAATSPDPRFPGTARRFPNGSVLVIDPKGELVGPAGRGPRRAVFTFDPLATLAPRKPASRRPAR